MRRIILRAWLSRTRGLSEVLHNPLPILGRGRDRDPVWAALDPDTCTVRWKYESQEEEKRHGKLQACHAPPGSSRL